MSCAELPKVRGPKRRTRHHAKLDADAAVRRRRDAAALLAGVARLDVLAHARREPIGADDEVEALARPVVEAEVDASVVLFCSCSIFTLLRSSRHCAHFSKSPSRSSCTTTISLSSAECARPTLQSTGRDT